MQPSNGGLTVFFDARSGEDLSRFFEHVEQYELREANTLSLRRRGQNRRYYKVVRVEPGFHTRVVVRRVVLHPWDILQLAIIAALCWYLFDTITPFFLD